MKAPFQYHSPHVKLTEAQQTELNQGLETAKATCTSDYPANPVSVYTALRDDPEKFSASAFIGVFSTEEKAQAACHEDAEDTDAWPAGWPEPRLRWKDAEALVPDGSKYVVVMTTLDVRTGMG